MIWVAQGERTGHVVSSQDVTVWPVLRGIYCNEHDAPKGFVLVHWHDGDTNEAEWVPLQWLRWVETDA